MSFNFADFLFILCSMIVFYGVILAPIFFIWIKIAYYTSKISYMRINYAVIFFNIPLVLLYYFFADIFSANSGNIYLLLVLYLVYSIPLVAFLAFYIADTSKITSFFKGGIYKNSKLLFKSGFFYCLLVVFALYNSIQFLLYFILLYFLPA